MNKSPELIELCTAIEQWAGKMMSGPTDFDALSMKIWDKTHVQLSSSTLKRIWGYYKDTGKAHRSSLDILAQCLEYAGYADFVELSRRHFVYDVKLVVFVGVSNLTTCRRVNSGKHVEDSCFSGTVWTD